MTEQPTIQDILKIKEIMEEKPSQENQAAFLDCLNSLNDAFIKENTLDLFEICYHGLGK